MNYSSIVKYHSQLIQTSRMHYKHKSPTVSVKRVAITVSHCSLNVRISFLKLSYTYTHTHSLSILTAIFQLNLG